VMTASLSVFWERTDISIFFLSWSHSGTMTIIGPLSKDLNRSFLLWQKTITPIPVSNDAPSRFLKKEDWTARTVLPISVDQVIIEKEAVNIAYKRKQAGRHTSISVGLNYYYNWLLRCIVGRLSQSSVGRKLRNCV